MFSFYQGDDTIDAIQGPVEASLTCIFSAGLFGYYVASEDVRVHNEVSWAACTATIVVLCVVLAIYCMVLCVYQ